MTLILTNVDDIKMNFSLSLSHLILLISHVSFIIFLGTLGQWFSGAKFQDFGDQGGIQIIRIADADLKMAPWSWNFSSSCPFQHASVCFKLATEKKSIIVFLIDYTPHHVKLITDLQHPGFQLRFSFDETHTFVSMSLSMFKLLSNQ